MIEHLTIGSRNAYVELGILSDLIGQGAEENEDSVCLFVSFLVSFGG